MDISDILSSLSPDDINKLKETASSLLGSQSATPEPSDAPVASDLLSAFGKLSADDERTALLRALRPLLSEQRQKKTDEAIKILRLMSLLPLLKDSGILGKLL